MVFTTARLRDRLDQVQQLRQSGQGAMADLVTREILAAPAASQDDCYCQAMLLMDLGRFTEAQARFDLALSRGAPTPELLVDRAVALIEGERFTDAIASCEAALKLNPHFAPAFLIQGDCLRDMGKPEEALQFYGQALAHNRDFTPALRNRADLNKALKNFEAALADFDKLARLEPNDPNIHNARGSVLGELHRLEDALRSFDRALALNPRHASTWHNRGVTLWNLERFEDAIASYDRALALAPNPITLSTKANTLQELLRLDEAMAVHDRAIAMQPDNASCHWNRSQGDLLRGNWKDGLREFEWRKKRPDSIADYDMGARKEWLGEENLAGKTLLIRAEQGFGDTIQFVRYAVLAQQRGARVILSVQPPLVRMLRDALVPAAASVIANTEKPPDFDFYIAAMSLPLAFGADVDNVYAPVPYLEADAGRKAAWAGKLGNHGFRIGFSWRGGGRGPNDVGRAFSPRHLAPLAGLPGVRLISLQKDAAASAQLRDVAVHMNVETLTDFDQDGAFLDTMAVMAHCDLVISSDTAVAHLAGALGRPTWLALKYVPEWRWQLHRVDTLWYPTMRLFRQDKIGDWPSVFVAMQRELAAKLAKS